MSLKDNWKATGSGLGHAFKDLGKTLVKTASTAANKVDKWANGDEQAEEVKEEPKVETKPEVKEQPKAETKPETTLKPETGRMQEKDSQISSRHIPTWRIHSRWEPHVWRRQFRQMQSQE